MTNGVILLFEQVIVVCCTRVKMHRSANGNMLTLTLSDASAADGFFENIVTKEEIAQNEQFLLLQQYFPLLVIGSLQCRFLQICYMWERVKMNEKYSNNYR